MTDERYPDVEGLVERLSDLATELEHDDNISWLIVDAGVRGLRSLQARLSKAEGERVDGFDKLTRRQQIDIERHVRGSTCEDGFYPAPRHGWTCFHCGETFKTEDGARLHFGQGVKGRPICEIDPAPIAEAIEKHVKVQWSGLGMHAGYRRIGVDGAVAEIVEAIARAATTQSDALQSEAAALRVERDHWKANHNGLLARYRRRAEMIRQLRILSEENRKLWLGACEMCAEDHKENNARVRASEAREAALRERVGELEKGLEPFARVDRDLPQEQPDDLTCAIHTSITSMGGAYAQRGDFRRAAQLLKDNPNG